MISRGNQWLTHTQNTLGNRHSVFFMVESVFWPFPWSLAPVCVCRRHIRVAAWAFLLTLTTCFTHPLPGPISETWVPPPPQPHEEQSSIKTMLSYIGFREPSQKNDCNYYDMVNNLPAQKNVFFPSLLWLEEIKSLLPWGELRHTAQTRHCMYHWLSSFFWLHADAFWGEKNKNNSSESLDVTERQWDFPLVPAGRGNGEWVQTQSSCTSRLHQSPTSPAELKV